MARKQRTAVNPLPSLIRATAEDAANARMRKAGRKTWTRADFNTAAATQVRLIRTCFSRKSDTDSNLCFVRFGIVEQLERERRVTLDTDWSRVDAYLDIALAA